MHMYTTFYEPVIEKEKIDPATDVFSNHLLLLIEKNSMVINTKFHAILQ